MPALLRRSVAELRPDIPLADLRPLTGYVDDELAPARSLGATTTVFAVVAVLLAALGIFGVLSLAVARRAAEIGYYPLAPTQMAADIASEPFPSMVYQWHKEGFDLPRSITVATVFINMQLGHHVVAF